MQRFLNHLGSALLDSGLRRNDDEEAKSLVAIPMARLPLPANTRLRPSRHLWTGSPVCGERAGRP